MNKKIQIILVTLLFLLNIICLTVQAKAMDITTNENSNQAVQHVDKVVDQLLIALNQNDYDQFFHYFNPDKNCTLSGSFRGKLSKETFDMMREEMLQKGGQLIAKKMITGDKSQNMVRNDYIATFENGKYIAKIGIIASNIKNDSCAVAFWIDWVDADKIDSINKLTDTILMSINKKDYSLFSKYFTNDLKLKYSQEEFLDLHKNINNELGTYQKQENIFYVNEKDNLSVSSRLFYNKSQNPIEFTIDTEFSNGNIIIKNIFFKWIPMSNVEMTDILAEKALVAICNENKYEKFISYFHPITKGQVTEDSYNKVRKAVLNGCDSYLSKQYVGANFLKTFYINGKKLNSPIETTIFVYKLSFENRQERYLNLTVAKEHGEMRIQSFYINLPTQLQYIGNLADKT